ncbi:amidase [Hydrogenophaga sp.]|uniref:amidase n=1 Tax=Hydrogenophaga sp. TaxID=1904254 RepID=UPI00260D1A87|nr:amidase [Hydrogenophaga sp.]MDM7948778.1 amidase [Hydrogenophaga sp.]
MTERTRNVSELNGLEIREHLLSGQETVEEFTAKLGRFADVADQTVKAFAHRDDRVVALQADHLQRARTAGHLPGPLYGVPVGIKDIIDTTDFPTEYGSPIHAGRYSVGDATVVSRLRAAGAVIFGKTVTTEFATSQPGATRNPHNVEHTPGGSSSGSAAAVAAGMVPVALGTQTNGSVIRPASFCGVYAFKPSRGLLPRTGVLDQSPSLDEIGVFARNLEDIAKVTEIMSGDDGQDPASARQSPRLLYDVAISEPPLKPKFCFVRTPWWDDVEPEAREAYEAFVEHLGDCVEYAQLPDIVKKTALWLTTVNEVELGVCLQQEWNHNRELLSETLRARVEKSMAISGTEYLIAKGRMIHVMSAFDEYFASFDAILCPAALGTAPHGLASTGNPIMQTAWSFAGLPSVNLPLLSLSNGLPLGVQAVGSYRNDGRLLRSSRWLVSEFVKRNMS